jgi:hypothetical protein
MGMKDIVFEVTWKYKDKSNKQVALLYSLKFTINQNLYCYHYLPSLEQQSLAVIMCTRAFQTHSTEGIKYPI